MAKKSVVPAKSAAPQRFLDSPGELLSQLSPLQQRVARLYGAGMRRREIARALVDHLAPQAEREPGSQLRMATAKLRSWEKRQKFRDAVYAYAVQDLDMEIPNVLRAVARKAQRGRVDAARLALEVSGRHNPRADSGPAQVVVAINGIPRPQMSAEEPVTYTEGHEVSNEEE